MSKSNTRRVVDFVREHPAGHVSDLMDGLGIDAASAWDGLLYAERDGLAELHHPEGQPWHFTIPAVGAS